MKPSRDLETYALRVADKLKNGNLALTAPLVRAVIMGAFWALTKLKFFVTGTKDKGGTDRDTH